MGQVCQVGQALGRKPAQARRNSKAVHLGEKADTRASSNPRVRMKGMGTSTLNALQKSRERPTEDRFLVATLTCAGARRHQKRTKNGLTQGFQGVLSWPGTC